MWSVTPTGLEWYWTGQSLGIAGRRDEPEGSACQMDKIQYIGDGVYAEYDGYSVLLRVGSHENEVAVVLEPEVLKALWKFYQGWAEQ